MNTAIWAALVHKTSGEARKKVNNTGQGSGLYAYIRVWRWFTGQSTTTQAESRAKILHPDQVKKIELLADVIEDWERRLNLMEERDLAGGEDVAVAKTLDKYKMSALWRMLPDPLRDEVDLKQGEHNGDYSKTRNFVMRFAEAKRKHRDDNMDVPPIQPEQPSGNEHWQQPWNPAWGNDGEEWLDPEVDAMQYGKGSPKGYGKGSYGKGGKGSFGSFSGKASWQQPGKGGKAPWQPPNYNKGFGKGGKPSFDGKGCEKGGKANVPRNAEGQAIAIGKCHSCGLPGHSAGRCPNLGGPMAHYSNCGKCGTYGHDAK